MKKEELCTKKEINKKKIQKLRKILSAGETFLMAMGWLIIGMAIIIGILVALSTEETTVAYEMSQMIRIQEIADIGKEEPIKDAITIMSSIIGYVLYIFIIDNIKKMLINIENDETPFSENNIAIFNKIKKLVTISFFTVFFGNEFAIGLIPLVTVLALVFVFEHGYELQKEVDETL